MKQKNEFFENKIKKIIQNQLKKNNITIIENERVLLKIRDKVKELFWNEFWKTWPNNQKKIYWLFLTNQDVYMYEEMDNFQKSNNIEPKELKEQLNKQFFQIDRFIILLLSVLHKEKFNYKKVYEMQEIVNNGRLL